MRAWAPANASAATQARKGRRSRSESTTRSRSESTTPFRIGFSWKIYGSAFKFFAAVDGKSKVNMQPVDRFVVEECILDVLLFFNGCRKECAFYLVSLPVSI
ncbi:unnamed protein product [Urochloa humidicola]